MKQAAEFWDGNISWFKAIAYSYVNDNPIAFYRHHINDFNNQR